MRPAPCRGGNLVIPLGTHADFSRQMITDSASILTTYCIVIAFWAFSFLVCNITDRYCMTFTMFEECNDVFFQTLFSGNQFIVLLRYDSHINSSNQYAE